MQVAYRKMRIEDEDAVFGLRLRTWSAPDIEYVRQGARSDPNYLRHIFVAIDPGGDLLSTVRYWVRAIRDASGVPQPVGCVASVVTVEAARRQGHAQKLMKLAIEEMRADGCAWSLLESSRMGVPLYLSLGYYEMPLPYYRGSLSGNQPQVEGAYRVERVSPPFNYTDANWQAVRNIYAIYNADRPLTLVRDDTHWMGYYARRVASRLITHDMSLFIAKSTGGEYSGYLIGDYSAPKTEGFDGYLYISELGVLPGHEGAIPDLLSAFLEGASAGHLELGVRAPRVGCVDSELLSLYGSDVQLLDCRMMALPLAPGVTDVDIGAIFGASGALFWSLDDF